MRARRNEKAIKRLLFTLGPGVLCLAGSLAWAGTLQVDLPERQLVQGDLRGLKVAAPEPLAWLRAHFRGMSLPVRADTEKYTVLLAVDLETPPAAYPVEFEAQGASGTRYRQHVPITVADGRFPVQQLTLPKGMVDLDAETLTRVRREQQVMASIWDTWRDGPYWWQAFALPLDGTPDVTSEFGLRRILNNQPRRPHNGIDFRASPGTPVLASNGGLVVYIGEMFFNGKSVILHHGGGLFTTYFHLQDFQVSMGQEVVKGGVIGWVGATGRATGPHLHWGANLRGVRFDPRRLLELSFP